jgi:hypothetical protein
MSLDATQKLQELAVTFAELRASDCRSYPEEVWRKAISLTKQIPVEEVCRVLSVQSAYFRKKMKGFEVVSVKNSDFVEVKAKNAISSELIIIDLETPTGFKAKIQGCSSCLCQVLNGLFREVQ